MDHSLELFARIMFGDANLFEIAAVTQAANQFHQRQTTFERQAAVRVRTADEILNQKRFAIDAWRQKQTPAIALPAFAQTARGAHGSQFVEPVVPLWVCLRPLQIAPAGPG